MRRVRPGNSRIPLWRWIAIAIAVVLLVPVAFVSYAILRIRSTRQSVDGWCAGVSVGDAVAPLERRATAHGLRVIDIPPMHGEPGRLMVWDGFVFARRFCDLEHDGTAVVAKKSSSLD